jgi:ribose 5-phosphate isomerase A
MSEVEARKQAAAERALDEVVSGMALGLGSGSTARYIAEGLAARLADGRLRAIVAVPTSQQTAHLARELGIPLATLDEQPELALTLDGADQIDPQLNLVKGLGAALLREKIVAAASRRLVIVADERKLVAAIGPRTPLPVEIIALARTLCERRLRALGLIPALRTRQDGAPLETDQGNYLLDCAFAAPATDLAALDRAIHAIPGVVEHGLFLGMADMAVIAGANGLRVLTRPERL